MVDPDCSFGVGEGSIGKRLEMGPKFGLVPTYLHVRRSSEYQKILTFEQRLRRKLTRCGREDT